MQISYTETEFLQYFEVSEWKGRELFDLQDVKRQIKQIVEDHQDSLKQIAEDKGKVGDQEHSDLVFTLV